MTTSSDAAESILWKIVAAVGELKDWNGQALIDVGWILLDLTDEERAAWTALLEKDGDQ